jgi:integrase
VLAKLVNVFANLSLRGSSKGTYASLLRVYERFCTDSGLDPCVKIDEFRLCQAAIYFCTQRQVTGLPNFCSALQWWHNRVLFGPLPKGPLYKQVTKGLKNVYGQFDCRKPAYALTLAQLYLFTANCNVGSFEHARNWCAAVFGFFGLLRVGEYTAKGSDSILLRCRSVTLSEAGVHLVLPFSKTSLRPVDVRICSRPDVLCPRTAALHYLSFFPNRGADRNPTDPFFVESVRSSVSLTPVSFISWLKAQATKIGVSSVKVSGHSLRRGGATALFLAGVSDTVIAQHGRWKSECFKIYYDEATPHFMATSILLKESSDKYTAHTHTDSSIPRPIPWVLVSHT